MTTILLRTIGEAERQQGKQNNFLLIRLIAAAAVIYGHSYAISPTPGHVDLVTRCLGSVWSGGVALYVFFVMSGFLVTASLVNRRSLAQYLTARALRIFPGLLVCLLLMTLVLGPLATELPLDQYFGNPEVSAYFTNNLFLIECHHVLPGVFQHNPNAGVNGSLWSLHLEGRLYLFLAALGILGLVHRRRLYNVAAVGLVLAGIFAPERFAMVAKNSNDLACSLLFLIGSLVYVNRNHIPLHNGVALFFLFVAFLFHDTNRFPYAFAALLVYGVLWLAYVPKIPALNRLGDYSYGVYIYGWPVQQVMKSAFPGSTPLQIFAMSLPTALALAVVSWHLIEKPALSLKNFRMQSLPTCMVKLLVAIREGIVWRYSLGLLSSSAPRRLQALSQSIPFPSLREKTAVEMDHPPNEERQAA